MNTQISVCARCGRDYTKDPEGLPTTCADDCPSSRNAPVPELAVDQLEANPYKVRLSNRQKAERQVVANLIAHLGRAGFELCAVNDGDETLKVSTPQEAMELIFGVDEAWLYVRKQAGKKRWIFLVMGNADDGSEIITDYGYSEGDPDGFSAAMESFDTELES